MRNSPIEIFKEWYKEELRLTEVRIPTTVCLSTHGTDEFPNGFRKKGIYLYFGCTQTLQFA